MNPAADAVRAAPAGSVPEKKTRRRRRVPSRPRRIQLAIAILALYVFLYNPIFLAMGIGSIKILLLACVAFAVLDPRALLLFRQFRGEAFFTAGLIIYAAAAAAMSPSVVSDEAYLHAVWFVESIVIAVILVHGFRRVLRSHGWEALIVMTGSVAAAISLILIAMPEWNQFVRTRIIEQSLDPEEWWFRGFAIAEGASFSYGIIQGLIVGICLWSVKRSKLYMLPVLPLLISIVFNARTGLVVVLMSLVLLLLMASWRLRLKLAWMLLVTVAAGIVLDSAVGLTSSNVATTKWIGDAFNDTKRLVSGDLSSPTYTHLFGDMLRSPSSLRGVLFGEPTSARAAIRDLSDIGYVNELFFGGALYLAMLLGGLAFMYTRVRGASGDRYYPSLFVVTLLVANVKWTSLFVPSGFLRLFCLYYVYTLLTRTHRIPVVRGNRRGLDEQAVRTTRHRVRLYGRTRGVHAPAAASSASSPLGSRT